ncbi:MAG: Hypothetical protein BHV28_00820 [Candidatus Tokpelaia hoelldobleri]|uniref:DUF1515 domain-containing protein n=1 Tax=Candidatus Tokpelaia hoelldobleri TaxID=1902579 RepID=A0A1U9JSG6_9HYPH|nr:MAG: Hypothetical protein BHV28_00820 [Candidatus Tokpelaia hoelldoblerii]
MTDNHDRAIGRIEGKLDQLIGEQRRATQKRGDMYKQLEALRKNQDEITRQIKDVDRRLEHVEKPIAEFSRWRERAVGAAMLLSMTAALIGGTVAAYWAKIVAIFR